MLKFLLPVLFLLLCSAWATALVVDGLYQASVTVKDHSQRQLQSAASEALSQVLVRVTGNPDVGNTPEIRTALNRAQDYLQQYQYRRHEDNLEVEISFDERLVTDLVLQAGLPLWTANRPAVLVWLVVDDRGGRQFAGADMPEGLHEAIREQFGRRGVPVTFPLLDLQDSMSLGVQEIWELNTLSAQRASERYGVADILIGRMTETSQGQWLGEWMYSGQGRRSEQSVYRESLEGFAAVGANLVADAMAAEFAVTGDPGSGSGIRLRVDGLGSFGDYRTIVDYLEGVELIEAVHAEFVSGSSAILQLRAQASADQLRRIIGLNRRLQSMESAPALAGSPPADLDYQWRP